MDGTAWKKDIPSRQTNCTIGPTNWWIPKTDELKLRSEKLSVSIVWPTPRKIQENQRKIQGKYMTNPRNIQGKLYETGKSTMKKNVKGKKIPRYIKENSMKNTWRIKEKSKKNTWQIQEESKGSYTKQASLRWRKGERKDNYKKNQRKIQKKLRFFFFDIFFFCKIFS